MAGVQQPRWVRISAAAWTAVPLEELNRDAVADAAGSILGASFVQDWTVMEAGAGDDPAPVPGSAPPGGGT
jgi:hypothetical protein